MSLNTPPNIDEQHKYILDQNNMIEELKIKIKGSREFIDQLISKLKTKDAYQLHFDAHKIKKVESEIFSNSFSCVFLVSFKNSPLIYFHINHKNDSLHTI